MTNSSMTNDEKLRFTLKFSLRFTFLHLLVNLGAFIILNFLSTVYIAKMGEVLILSRIRYAKSKRPL